MIDRKNKILVTQPSMPSIEEYLEEIRDIWDSKWITNMGIKHNSFMQLLIDYLEVEHIELLTNGHMALELTLQALNINGEVITTPFTFASTTHAIVRNNLTPVFCDIKADDFTMDANKIEELITDKTCAILPVHVYGNICEVERIQEIADKYGLKVVYDAAHAFGEKYKGIGVGNFGDASCFSFHATKIFNSIEGGSVSFKDVDFGRKIYQLKNFGIKGPEEVDGVGANAKMNEFCAAMGICNLAHVAEEIQKRKLAVEHYCRRLGQIEGIKINDFNRQDIELNYSYFPIVVDEKIFGKSRNEISQILFEKGIYTRKYFYPLTSSYECFHNAFDVNKTPIALHVSKRILTLPLYAGLLEEDIDRICDIIIDSKG